jgi:hypothetical protein
MIGDRVSVDTDNGRRYGVIAQMTDTSRLHSMFTGQPTDDQFRSFTYVINMEDNGEEVTRYKASELQRDRRVYSKLVLKQFLRSAVSREAWNGAPWMVKDRLAKRYNIPTKIPEAKTRDAVMAAKKAANAIANGTHPSMNQSNMGYPHPNGALPLGMAGAGAQATFVNFAANGHPLPPGHNGHPMMPPPTNGMPPPPYGWDRSGPPPIHYIKTNPYPVDSPPTLLYQPPPPHLAHLFPQQPMGPPGSGTGLPIGLPFQNNFMQYQTLAPTNQPQQQLAPPLSKPFEPVKYPIDDLRIKQPRTSVTRPPLKFFADDVPEGNEPLPEEKKTGIQMKSMGPLLCTWETLNVHDTIYMLDSFTFDDFVEAMAFSSEEVECELLVEVHCAVLKQYINSSGKLQVPLPHMSDDEDSEDEESSKESTPEPEPEPPVRTTRSSLRKSEASQIAVKLRTPTPEPPKQLHNATEFLADFDWVEQCKIRNFRDGGWQAILVGLLHRLSFNPTHKEACDEILAKLVPPDEDPTVEKIAENYLSLDVNLRISALEMALRLTVTTEHFRDQLIAASQEMTRLRKEKIDFQKKRKELYVNLYQLWCSH